MVLIVIGFAQLCYLSQMLNERGYERETNCSGMLRTSSKLQPAQRVYRACHIRIHANEPATAWADTPRLI